MLGGTVNSEGYVNMIMTKFWSYPHICMERLGETTERP